MQRRARNLFLLGLAAIAFAGAVASMGCSTSGGDGVDVIVPDGK